MDRIEVSLALLRSLSSARLKGDEARAGELAVKLLEWDYAHGYNNQSRGDRALRIVQHGEKHTGTLSRDSRYKRSAGKAAE